MPFYLQFHKSEKKISQIFVPFQGFLHFTHLLCWCSKWKKLSSTWLQGPNCIKAIARTDL